METKVLTAHVPLPLAKKIDDLAARLDRPRAWIVKQALAAWVGEEEERHRLTMEGMADVTAGRVVDQTDVEVYDRLALESKKDRLLAQWAHMVETEPGFEDVRAASGAADVVAGESLS